MKKICAALLLALTTTGSAFAGGILTNTNQSIDFLRNPARDGAIGIDGVYSNPAGVAFMNDGFHLSFNWQAAFQTRTVETTNQVLAYGAQNNGQGVKTYKGNAKAPFLPSIQAAYNKDRWSFQFSFAVSGGGGKCTFDNGLGSFETAVGNIGLQLSQAAEKLQAGGIAVPSVTGYDANSFMQGNQYYFGFTLGTAYKVNKNLSIYGGLRFTYGTASYKAKINDIKVVSGTNSYTLPQYSDALNQGIDAALTQVGAGINQINQVIATYGDNTPKKYVDQLASLQATQTTLQNSKASLQKLSVYNNGVNLQCDQTGFGVAPIIGIDYKMGDFNFAAKYEFRTKMQLTNKSDVNGVVAIAAVEQFRDGKKIREDIPALLSLGAQWSIKPNIRVNVGYHHFFDKEAHKTYCYESNGEIITSERKNDLLKGGTNEYLGGAEWDPIDKLTVSGGFQITRYGLSDEYMSDMSFVVNSWTFGLGAKYQINKHIAAQVAYFQTNYGHYKTADVIDSKGNPTSNNFTRTNNVIGAGITVDF